MFQELHELVRDLVDSLLRRYSFCIALTVKNSYHFFTVCDRLVRTSLLFVTGYVKKAYRVELYFCMSFLQIAEIHPNRFYFVSVFFFFFFFFVC